MQCALCAVCREVRYRRFLLPDGPTILWPECARRTYTWELGRYHSQNPVPMRWWLLFIFCWTFSLSGIWSILISTRRRRPMKVEQMLNQFYDRFSENEKYLCHYLTGHYEDCAKSTLAE